MVINKPITNQKIWEAFLLKHTEANFLQSYSHGLTHQELGKKVFYDGYYKNNKLIGICLSILEPAVRGAHLVIPGGPILDWKNKLLVKTWKQTIISHAKKNHCVFARVRPQLTDDQVNHNLFKNLGFIPAPMHLSAQTTLQLDLTPSLEQLLAQMRKTTRYEIRQAQKLDIQITTSSKLEDVSLFCKTQEETARRQNFIPFSSKLILSEFKHFVKNNQALLYSAHHKKTLIAQALIIHYPNESSYHFGASTPANRQFPGAYLIQWQAIQDAKNRNIPRYNFWGIVEETQTKHRFYGVSVFKRGFGGTQVNYLPAQDLIISPLRYIPLYIFETLRRKIRHL